MSKYNFELDMSSDNSNSVILKNIKPNSKVLEIGCAHGRMTKYLKEILNCKVTIVEKDIESGEIAKQWAETHYIGVNGDIENIFPIMHMGLLYDTFDYIIFADVLEHLYDPKSVLKKSKSLLKTNGSVWISIPNIAHNSVLIDLWNNKFEYKDIGLLDNTHFRFFTESSLRKMATDCELIISKEINLTNTVENTEFNNSYNNVPLEIIKALKNREYAEIYQFVWELKQ